MKLSPISFGLTTEGLALAIAEGARLLALEMADLNVDADIAYVIGLTHDWDDATLARHRLSYPLAMRQDCTIYGRLIEQAKAGAVGQERPQEAQKQAYQLAMADVARVYGGR